MYEFTDTVDFYIGIINALKLGIINPHLPLEEIILKDDKVKISVVDGSFFETVPKEHLIYQLFLNILRGL